jgi:hypothetical protein
MLDGDPATHQEQLEKMRSSINRAETQDEESRANAEYAWADVEEDPQKVEEYERADEDAYDTFSENVDATRPLVNVPPPCSPISQPGSHQPSNQV